MDQKNKELVDYMETAIQQRKKMQEAVDKLNTYLDSLIERVKDNTEQMVQSHNGFVKRWNDFVDRNYSGDKEAKLEPIEDREDPYKYGTVSSAEIHDYEERQ